MEGDSLHPNLLPEVLRPISEPVNIAARDKLEWKHLANTIANKEVSRWTNDQIVTSHRVAEYAGIATELRLRAHNPYHYPQYLTIDGLSKSERRNIAIFRRGGWQSPLGITHELVVRPAADR